MAHKTSKRSQHNPEANGTQWRGQTLNPTNTPQVTEQEVLLNDCVATHGSGRVTWMNKKFSFRFLLLFSS